MGVKCNYCGEQAELVTGDVVYPHREDLAHLKLWVCNDCDARVGCHGNSDKPMGNLANTELRLARSLAHQSFDPIWKGNYKSRTNAYSWLAYKLKISKEKCHIGMFDISTCNKTIAICNEYYNKRILDEF